MIVLVCGTRPELVKLYPVCLELRQRNVAFRVLFTGQHTTLASTVNFLDMFKDVVQNLDLPSDGDPWRYVAHATRRIGDALERIPGVHWVVVQGDTSSTLAGARAAATLGIPVAHIEAGLRTHDFSDPYPEEHFRVEVTHLASRHFAPTSLSRHNLLDEGVQESDILVTGNTVVDMLRLHTIVPLPTFARSGILVTLHRRESAGEPMRQILLGLQTFSSQRPDIPISLVGHPNGFAAAQNPGFTLLPPMPYLDFVKILARSQAVLTDSGGVIEEATTLQVPCVIARDHTERPEAIASGHATIAGRSAEHVDAGLRRAWIRRLDEDDRTANPFGSGYASTLIVNSLIGR